MKNSKEKNSIESIAIKALKLITQFEEAEYIFANPIEAGGTDDGAETLIMAYENMQSVAEAALMGVLKIKSTNND